MRFRNLDSNNDWNFGKGNSDYVLDSAAIALDVKTRLQSWIGDCFFAQDEGVNYTAYLGQSDLTLLSEDVQRVIVQTDGVAEITDFQVSLVNRVFNATYRILTIFSEEFQGNVSQTV